MNRNTFENKLLFNIFTRTNVQNWTWMSKLYYAGNPNFTYNKLNKVNSYLIIIQFLYLNFMINFELQLYRFISIIFDIFVENLNKFLFR